MGPLAVLMAHAMMGEVTPRMAEAVSMSKAKKILIPLTQEKVTLVGIAADPLPHLVEEAVRLVKEMVENV